MAWKVERAGAVAIPDGFPANKDQRIRIKDGQCGRCFINGQGINIGKAQDVRCMGQGTVKRDLNLTEPVPEKLCIEFGKHAIAEILNIESSDKTDFHHQTPLPNKIMRLFAQAADAQVSKYQPVYHPGPVP